jgi:hypothetical protein
MKRKLPRLIGVLHLPPLPGAPGSAGLEPSEALGRAGEQAVREAIALQKAGFDGLIVENFGDAPFYKDQVPPETIASMAVLAAALRDSVRIPVGVNILRNAGLAAQAVASVTGCDFIRVNVLSGAAATDQGLIETQAAQLLRERARLSSGVAILADVLVKHARSLSVDDVELAIEEVGLRSGADAVILTGATTGRGVDPVRLERASRAARQHGIPLYIGSGMTAASLAEGRRKFDGVIVGSDLRKGGRAGAPLDSRRVAAFVKAFRKGSKKR